MSRNLTPSRIALQRPAPIFLGCISRDGSAVEPLTGLPLRSSRPDAGASFPLNSTATAPPPPSARQRRTSGQVGRDCFPCNFCRFRPKSGRIQEHPRRSEKIRENPRKSEKIREDPEKSRNIRKILGKFREIRENPNKGKKHPH